MQSRIFARSVEAWEIGSDEPSPDLTAILPQVVPEILSNFLFRQGNLVVSWKLGFVVKLGYRIVCGVL